jgi:Leucine-rich repeat (LRR) protein
MRLTLAKISEWNAGKDLRLLEVLDARNKELEELDDISSCIELRKLLLSENRLTQIVEGIGFAISLTYLDVSYNQLTSLIFVQRLVRLCVLNASHNNISAIGYTEQLIHLKALILNHNKITTIENLGHLKELNTLVLSHNRIETFQGLRGLECLKKLSLAHNNLREVPPLECLSGLKELKLNHNKLAHIPSHLVYNSRLELLDLGNNYIRETTDLALLASLLHLRHVNLQGNPICNDLHYEDTVKRTMVRLKILDGRPLQKKQAFTYKSLDDLMKKSKVIDVKKEDSSETHGQKRKRNRSALPEEETIKTLSQSDKTTATDSTTSQTGIVRIIEGSHQIVNSKKKKTKLGESLRSPIDPSQLNASFIANTTTWT